jgi:cyclopropane fatty-acyl-phospholipid synthase-like methyltransferase
MYELPYSEACERNKKPILSVLRDVLPAQGCVLEIGSCTGQHVVYFASSLGALTWQPSDRLENLSGLNARVLQQATTGIQKPIELDVLDAWPDRSFDAVYSANTAHIMSWPAVVAMFSGVGRVLSQDGVFCLYGPFIDENGHTAKSNEDFDQSLRQRDPVMGIRDLGALKKLAQSAQLRLMEKRPMPANNQLLVFRRCGEILHD